MLLHLGGKNCPFLGKKHFGGSFDYNPSKTRHTVFFFFMIAFFLSWADYTIANFYFSFWPHMLESLAFTLVTQAWDLLQGKNCLLCVEIIGSKAPPLPHVRSKTFEKESVTKSFYFAHENQFFNVNFSSLIWQIFWLQQVDMTKK